MYKQWFFFEKGKPTKKLWYYQLNLERNLGKTNSLNDNDLKDFVKLVKTKDNSKNSWCIDIEKINKDTFDIETQNLISLIKLMNELLKK